MLVSMKPRPLTCVASRGRAGKGFSLVEILVVMAVIVVISLVAVPFLRSVGDSRVVTQDLYDAASLVEFARSEAVARQTYVWVGFQGEMSVGRPVLLGAAVYSRDGSSDGSPENLASLTKVYALSGIVLSKWGDLKAATRATVPDAAPRSVAENPSSISFRAGRNDFKNTLTFTPRGEAMLAGAPDVNTPYDAQIDVSFRQAQGAQVRADADDGALLIDGGTGTVRKVRVQ